VSRRGPRARDVALGAVVVVCALSLIWPVYEWLGGSIEPYVLGLPWSFAWVVGQVVLSFVALAVYHLTGDDERR